MTPLVEFVEKDRAYTGSEPGGRAWRITRSLTGWRLEFRDDGDVAATFAGVHASLPAAKAEANRPCTRHPPGRRGPA